MPVSLFDQSAAYAEKLRRELEEAGNATAGFDELHDISGDAASAGGENNLFGDIYTPELSPAWQEMAEKIGDIFANVVKGDMGFGEALDGIWDIISEKLGEIKDNIWEWFKGTDFGGWLVDNWKKY